MRQIAPAFSFLENGAFGREGLSQVPDPGDQLFALLRAGFGEGNQLGHRVAVARQNEFFARAHPFEQLREINGSSPRMIRFLPSNFSLFSIPPLPGIASIFASSPIL